MTLLAPPINNTFIILRHPHLKIIFFKFKGVRADIVLEVVTFPHGLCHVKGKRRFLACAVKIVEDTQLVTRIQFRTLRA